MALHNEKKLSDPTHSKHKQGDFNADMSAGSIERREKTNQDFTKNSDPGGDQKAFPTASGGLASNNVHSSWNDYSLIKAFP